MKNKSSALLPRKVDQQPARPQKSTPSPDISPTVDEGHQGHLVRSIQRSLVAPTPSQILHLQRTIGNRAAIRLIKNREKLLSQRKTEIEPTTVSQKIQREVYLGGSTAPLDLTTLSFWQKHKGSGARNVTTMVTTADRKYYFNDQAEMIRYAEGKTEDIGYLVEEKAWIRLPAGNLLVLGENHADTTTANVAKALGTQKYIYEPFTEFDPQLMARSKRLKSTVNARRELFTQKAGHKNDTTGRSNVGETFAPKAVIGLMSAMNAVNDAVTKGYTDNAIPVTSGGGGGYDRNAVVLMMLKNAVLVAAKAAKYNQNPQPLWQTNQAIFNTTAKQFRENKHLRQTEFIRAIEGGTFTYNDFIDSFKDAADDELANAGDTTNFAGFVTQDEDIQATQLGKSNEAEVQKYERMREFQMLKKIRAARAGGFLFAGIGDVHRLHLEAILDQEPGIYVRQLNAASMASSAHPTFVDEQKAAHPQ